MEAEVAQQLEQDRKGERFTLIEPPQYPERPTSPNRLVIVLAGFVFSLVGGMTAGGVREALDSTVKGSSELVRILRVPVLSVIPATLPENYEEQARRQQWFVIGALLMGLVIVMVLVHFFFMPLDILWYSFLRRSFG
jgi:hypothetical protein